MTDTPGRLLTLLSLLQTPREWSGTVLAERLGVTTRTIRRDIDRLRELGYPVQATLGAEGGYRLVAGAAMPPLLLDDEEAVAIAVGLRTAAGQAVQGIEEASVRALTKLEQVLPSRLRRRVATLGSATVPMYGPTAALVDPENLTALAAAVANHERVRFSYQAGDGAESKRLVEPHRLVSSGRRWYLVAFDVDRDDWRIFRVDRVTEPRAIGTRSLERTLPAADAAEYVTNKLYSLVPTYSAVATIHAPASKLAGVLGDRPADLEVVDENTCRLHSHTDTLEWLAFRLAMLGCEFEVHSPPELAQYLRELAGRVTRAVAGTPSVG
ncbi:helix-turn-helix transcriptional regulator [Crossiella cryophila]|uniref:Putative DNA-binding transcriptional regulator YafY n=1 Tax=Crossiella cryophila TaxID=43355 RepID=A0A7W7CDW2_9PSEU|nr:YafY family protein [Crossiella cryophila]MBB4679348.1 putative DNA-binding transcriptional regulator YafY [Crossiella cryophila]